jgi:hypothetical protein
MISSHSLKETDDRGRIVVEAGILSQLLAFILAVGGFLVVPSTGAAAAENCNENNGGCVPDATPHTWCDSVFFTFEDALKQAREHALDNMVSQTNYSRQHVGTYQGDCPSSTDTFWIVDDSLGSTRGTYQCRSFNDAGNCAHAWIRLNPDALSNQLNRNKTACHELGHSLGLEHHPSPYNDCMMSGAVTSGHQSYNGAHVNRINDRSGDIGH